MWWLRRRRRWLRFSLDRRLGDQPDQHPDQDAKTAADQVIRQLFGVNINRSESGKERADLLGSVEIGPGKQALPGPFASSARSAGLCLR